MPPRLLTGAILAFWLAMTGWLIQREVVPLMLADVSPNYVPDLTDEIGAPLIGWRIFRDGKPAGTATSRVLRTADDKDFADLPVDDRSFLFRSAFHFDRDIFPVKKMESVHRVTEDGKLHSIKLKIALLKELQLEFKGDVVDQQLEPRLFLNGVEFKEVKLGKVDLATQGNVINSLNLIGRLRGLRVGQTWKVTSLDLGRFMPQEAELFGDFLKKAMKSPDLIAVVKLDEIDWDRRKVACFLIEYKVGDDVAHKTWVRRADGLVLMWELAFLDGKMTLVRTAT